MLVIFESINLLALYLISWLVFFHTFSILRNVMSIPVIASVALYLALNAIFYTTSTNSLSVVNLSLDLLVTAGLIGFLAALPWAFVIENIATAARVVDTLRGAQIAEVFNPGMSQPQSLLERVTAILLLLLFFSLDRFLSIIPLTNQAVQNLIEQQSNFTWDANYFLILLEIFSATFKAGLVLALPLLGIILLLDLGFGLLTRFNAKLNATFEFLGVKLLIGILIFIFSVQLILPEIEAEIFEHAYQVTYHLLAGQITNGQ